MKLASLKAPARDGTLVVVARDLSHAAPVPDAAPTLQAALEDWARAAPVLDAVYGALNEGGAEGAFALDATALASPLPRAYQWLDASAYLNHVELVRKARGAEMPPGFLTDPLMYQGGSDAFLGPTDDIEAGSEDWGIDMEGEVAVITDDVPMGIGADEAGGHIRLLMLVNDVSLRNLIPAELAKGFGFLHAKPASAFSPVAVTPDELGGAWDGARVHLALHVDLNGAPLGRAEAGDDMQFGFPELIAHGARTRELAAGTIIGSGTVSNRDPAKGCSCLAEKRTHEIIDRGEATTPFMGFGDRVRIEMLDREGQSIFGAIDQKVVKAPD
ncbi:MAG: fumarylacetoacetate hydrolase family protein [Alphaproteobacteria bacterium]